MLQPLSFKTSSGSTAAGRVEQNSSAKMASSNRFDLDPALLKWNPLLSHNFKVWNCTELKRRGNAFWLHLFLDHWGIKTFIVIIDCQWLLSAVRKVVISKYNFHFSFCFTDKERSEVCVSKAREVFFVKASWKKYLLL